MGAECSYDRKIDEIENTKAEPKNTHTSSSSSGTSDNINNLEFKSYKDFNVKNEHIGRRMQDIIKKAETVNDFTISKK
jgi:hypothetical protein